MMTIDTYTGPDWTLDLRHTSFWSAWPPCIGENIYPIYKPHNWWIFFVRIAQTKNNIYSLLILTTLGGGEWLSVYCICEQAFGFFIVLESSVIYLFFQRVTTD